MRRITNKFRKQQQYAKEHLPDFKNRHFMFWSPVVPRGYVTDHLERINGLELVINDEYKRRIEELRVIAAKETYDARNPFSEFYKSLNTFVIKKDGHGCWPRLSQSILSHGHNS